MTARSRLCFYASLLAAAWPAAAGAAWRIESRPLEKKGALYARTYAPLLKMVAGASLTRLEGAGLEIARGTSRRLFTLPLPTRAPRRLELQLGYLATAKRIDPARRCHVVVKLAAGGERPEVREEHDLPLRSLHPEGERLDDLRSRWDYLAPAFTFEVPAEARELTLTVSAGADCDAGKVIVLDPKVWIERPGSPHRLILLVADQLNGEWFRDGRRFAPAIQDFFAGPGSFLTQGVSNGSVTMDTVAILSRMGLVVRGLSRVRIPEKAGGLLPPFLDAGYDAVAFTSNALVSTAFDGGMGFRHIYDVDSVADLEACKRHPELLAALAQDWIAHHPDHDALVLVWTSSTHRFWVAPRWRPDFDPTRTIYPQYRNQPLILAQGHTLSYVDLALEPLLASPLVQASDVFFFADHGNTWDHFNDEMQDWSACSARARSQSYLLLTPVALDVPIGVHLHDRPFDPAPAAEASLLDWMGSIVRRHNPAIDTSGWEGVDVTRVTPQTPLLIAGTPDKARDYARMAMRVGGRNVLYGDLGCPAGGPPVWKVWDEPAGFPAASDADRVLLKGELEKRGQVVYRRIDLDVYDAPEACSITVRGPLFLDERGAGSEEVKLDSDGWYNARSVYVSELDRELVVRSEPPGCLRIQAGLYQRSEGWEAPLSKLGYTALLDAAREPIVPGRQSVLRVAGGPRVVRVGDRWVPVDPAAAAGEKGEELSSQLREAMKRWGYIQDDRTR